jgi:hypothetical protein
MGAASRAGVILLALLRALAAGGRVAIRWLGWALAIAETPLVRLFVRVGLSWASLRIALGAMALGLATLILVGFLRLPEAGDGAPLKLALHPVYVAEQAQMRSDAPVFGRGLRANAVRAWARIPSDGSMFGVTRAEIRSPLQRLLPAIDDVADGWAADQTPTEAAAQLVSDLKKVDDRQKQHGGGADRVAIEYHMGLAELFNGDQQDAEGRMQNVLRLINARLAPLEDAESAGTDQGATGDKSADARQTDLVRLYDVAIAADYALGLADLADPGKHGDAMAALNDAISLANAHQDVVASPADRLTTKLFTLDPQTSLVKLDTADIYADLLAATIASAAQGDRKATGELAFLVKDLQGKSMSGRPRLAANLEIAALLTGAADAVGSFAPDAASDDPGLAQVSSEVHAVASTDQAVPELHNFWNVTHAWRIELANGEAADIRRSLAQSSKELGPERAWLGEVLNDAYDDLKAPADRARFIQQYGDLLQGVTIFRSLEANMPLARYAGLPAWLATWLTWIVVGLLWFVFLHAILLALRTREPWRVIYGSGYAADFRAHRPEPRS